MAEQSTHPFSKLAIPQAAGLELRQTDNGWAAFATKPGKAPILVLVEEAWFIIRKPLSDIVADDIATAISKLSRVQRKQYRRMGRASLGISVSDSDSAGLMENEMLLSTFKQSALAIDEFVEGDLRMGFYPIASRLKHSCLPNSSLSQSDLGVVARFMHGHNIAVGDELTRSTLTLNECLTKSQRHALLGYVCTCNLCSADAQTCQLSDQRRVLLRGCLYILYGKDRAGADGGGLTRLRASILLSWSDAKGLLDHVNMEELRPMLANMTALIADPRMQTKIEEFRLPIGKRFSYCCLAMALLQAEGLMNDDYWAKLYKMLFTHCMAHFRDERNIMRVMIFLINIPMEVPTSFAKVFKATPLLWDLVDSGDSKLAEFITTQQKGYTICNEMEVSYLERLSAFGQYCVAVGLSRKLSLQADGVPGTYW